MELVGKIINKTLATKGVLVNKTLVLSGCLSVSGEPIYIGGETYEGSYIVTPKAFSEQTLLTSKKVMKDNVTVKEIPYYEVSNVSGITVSIGD